MKLTRKDFQTAGAILAFQHILVGSAIALAALFGLRSLVLFSRGGGTADLALAAVSIATVGVLVVHFRKLRARWAKVKRDWHG